MPTPYTRSVIRNFRHKGLRRLFQTGYTGGVPAQFVEKLRDILAVLNAGRLPDDAIGQAGFGTHPLTGERRGTWSIVVTRNWRVTFRIVEEDAADVDFEDYH